MGFLYINFVVVLWVTAITTLLLGAFVLIRNYQHIVNKTFAFYSFSISWWSFCEIWGIACDKKSTALTWTRIEQIGVFFIPTFCIHFVISLLNIKNKKWLLQIAYFFSTIFAILSFTPLMMADSVKTVPYVKYFGTPGLAYHFAILFFIILCGYVLIKLYSAYKSSSGARRNQLKYLFWSSLFGYFGGGANFLLVYGISLPFINPFGTYALPIYIAVMAYAILKHHLMDIEAALTRAFILTAVYVCVIGATLIVASALQVPLQNVVNNLSMFITLSIFVILSLSAPYTYLYFQQRYDEKRLTAQREQFSALKQITQGSLEIEDLSHLLKVIPHFLMQMYQAKLKTKISQTAVYFYDATTKLYIMVAHRGSQKPSKAYLTTDDALIFWFTKKVPYLVQKGYYKEKELQALRNEDIDFLLSQSSLLSHEQGLKNLLESIRLELAQLKAHICVPCFYQKECTGILILGEKTKGSYNQEEIDALSTVSNHIAMSIRSAQLRQDLTASYLEAITSIAKSLEARDPYTKGHSERVALYSLAIAAELQGKPPYNQIVDFQVKIQQAALLHDVGKIGIRDDILLKPGGLNPEEVEVIRQHPQIGEHILSGLKGISRDVLLGIRYHHEKYDGSGTTEIKGEQIPPIARILAVADTYDAMTTDRPYRKGLSDREALKEIIKNTYYQGPQWDPKVVEAMLEAFKKGIFKQGVSITQEEIEQIKREIEVRP
ncbi:MAG: histidine kinase N-terminal 7TM domain-containing protein [Candidatus Omnitrophica bacterium]|nr:histidine kinase N-terminal 7TM domain-containing protein [Candidatus Omnitrophota bacterium]